jgi:hypothetical protein
MVSILFVTAELACSNSLKGWKGKSAKRLSPFMLWYESSAKSRSKKRAKRNIFFFSIPY